MLLFIAALPKTNAFKPNKKGNLEIPKLIRRGLERGLMVKAISLHYNPKSSTARPDNPNLIIELDDS